MCDNHLTSELFSIAPWRTVEILHDMALRVKETMPLAPQNVKIAQHVSAYEDFIRGLWQEAKDHPTKANIVKFIEAMVVASDKIWEKYYLDLLDLEDLLPHHRAQLDKDLKQHKYYLQHSLLPDLLKETGKGSDAFNKYDYRVIFLYAGAMWSAGMLATVMFDGLEFRDLADVFLFAGPDDENTCTGDRGCKQHVGKLYTVAQILAEDIIPGHFRCLTSCRHMLIPIASPLKAEKHLPGKHSQASHNPHRGSSVSGKVWNGEPVEWDGPKLSKLEVGAIGEQLAMRVLSERFGTEFSTLNVGMNNAPIDVGGDHTAVEVKTGLASNGKTAQHWRATIGQPGKAEQALISRMSSEEKRLHNQYKEQKILERKRTLLDELSALAGAPVKGMTVGIILHPNGKKADMYQFDGFHLRIPWNKAEEVGAYLGSYDV